MEKCWAVAGFDAGSPCGGSCGTGAVSSLPQPPRSGRDAISIPRWSLSEWWLINELGLQLSVRKRNCLFHPCHRPNWESLVRSMYRHQIHKKTFSKIAVIFMISPLQHSSPQEIQQSTLEFLSEAERQEGLTQPFSLITFMIRNTKHKFVLQALWHWKSHALFHLEK